MQLKSVVRPALFREKGKPLIVDIARAKNGMSLVSLSTSSNYQNIPKQLLELYLTTTQNVEFSVPQGVEDKFINLLTSSLIKPEFELNTIKTELSELISFILVYDLDGNYIFSTAKSSESVDLIKDEISVLIKNQYRDKLTGKEFPDIIGLKKLHDSVIWHFKVFDRIFVFFTYQISESTEFNTAKTDLLTFINNEISRFVLLAQQEDGKTIAKDKLSSDLGEITLSRIILEGE